MTSESDRVVLRGLEPTDAAGLDRESTFETYLADQLVRPGWSIG
jgi:hypothetical protein